MGREAKLKAARRAFREEQVRRHPRGSSLGGRFRERFGAAQYAAFAVGGAFLAHEINERAERGFNLLEYAHVVGEGTGLLHRTTTTDALRAPRGETSTAWADRIGDRAGSEVQRRQNVEGSMSADELRRAEIRRFSAAASMPSEASMTPVKGQYGLSVESARPSGGGNLPTRDPGRRLVEQIAGRVSSLTHEVDPAHRFYVQSLITKLRVGEVPMDRVVWALRDLKGRVGGGSPRTSSALDLAAKDLSQLLEGVRPEQFEPMPGSFGGSMWGPQPAQHPGVMAPPIGWA